MSLEVWFVVDRSTNPPRTGRVTAEEGSRTTVEWRDGSIETLPKLGSRQIKDRSDSVLGRFAQSPDDFTERFLADPLPVFVAALRDGARRDARHGAKRTFKAADLQQSLTPFGPTGDQVKSAWKQVQSSIKDLPDVVAVSGTYRWVGETDAVTSAKSEDEPAEASDFKAATESKLIRNSEGLASGKDQQVTSETPQRDAAATESVMSSTAVAAASEKARATNSMRSTNCDKSA